MNPLPKSALTVTSYADTDRCLPVSFIPSLNSHWNYLQIAKNFLSLLATDLTAPY